jgi:two-component system, chemotaxis family, protein-glutamate methylesterase/glutaminase
VGCGRVLLVDDSVVVRKLVSELLTRELDLELCATAPNGRLALEKLPRVAPDLVILDIEMPELDGIATLREIRARAPSLPVLMFSRLTERAGSVTLDALAMGAWDYVTKPANVGNSAVPLAQVQEQLVAKVRALLPGPPPAPLPTALARAQRATKAPAKGPLCVTPVELVVIGASTGGPNALAEILALLPGDLPVPVVIVQHMPPLFTKLFADRLDQQCHLRVREGASGERLLPGDVWIAPGDHHLSVRRDEAELSLLVHQGMPENSCRPSVDVLFRSAAEACGPRALGVILTGMGQDGLRGCRQIREAGGQILAQDERTSIVWSMPGVVAQAGLADEVLPLEHIALAIERRIAARAAEAGA